MQKIGDITDTADGNGEFTDGNVAGNVQPTELMAAWFNSVQREVIAVLSAAGITPDKSDDAQLIAAINAILAKGIAGSGYLISKNNLSDLDDAAKSRGHLGLGKLAVLDSLSASDVNAFPAAGGTVGSSGVITPGLHVNSNALGAADQGNHLLWNETGGRGESDFVCNAGGGIGGFIFRTVNNDNTQEYGRVDITGTGSLNTSNTLNEMGQRVYSPNNPPPITNSAITSIRRGGQAYSAGSGTGTGRTWEAPSGCYMTGINTDVSDGRGMGVYYRSVQAYSASAGWIQIGDES